MNKIVYINACVRKEKSRTLRLANPLLDVLRKRYDVFEIDLTENLLSPITTDLYIERCNKGITVNERELGEKVAKADRIVIAAPFWDMSFPSVLKVFFEHISVPDLTFINNDDGTTSGNCKSKKVLYITTRGMKIETDSVLDQGTPYLRALSWLWGIGDVQVLSVSGTDIYDNEVIDDLLKKEIEKGLKICEDF